MSPAKKDRTKCLRFEQIEETQNLGNIFCPNLFRKGISMQITSQKGIALFYLPKQGEPVFSLQTCQMLSSGLTQIAVVAGSF